MGKNDYKSPKVPKIFFELIFWTLVLRLSTGAFKSLESSSINIILSALYLSFAPLLILYRQKINKILLQFILILFALSSISMVFLQFDVSGTMAQLNAASRYLLPIVTVYYVYCEVNSRNVNIGKIYSRRFKQLALIIIILSLTGLALGLAREIQGQSRIEFPFENPNTLGIYYGLTAWISLSLLTTSTNFSSRIPLIAIYFLSVFFTILSGSLNGLVLTLSSAIFYMLFISQNKWIRMTFFLVGVVALSAIVNIELIADRIAKVFFTIDLEAPGESGSSLIWRLHTWLDYLESMSMSDYIFGNGPGASRIWFSKWAPGFYINSFGDIPGTHNDYLAVFFDFGILGVFFLIYAIYKYARWFLKNNYAAFAGMIIMTSASMFFDNIVDSILSVVIVYFIFPFYFHARRENERRYLCAGTVIPPQIKRTYR